MALDQLPDAFAVDVALLKPTQFDTGMAVVRRLREKMKSLFTEGEDKLDAYCQDWVVPVVIGPDNHMFVIDRHSECAAMYYTGLNNRNVYVRMVANWSHMDVDDFWNMMLQRKFCYLLRKGKKDYSLLPSTFAELPDDPYRSLAWACRVNDPPGFRKEFRKDKYTFTEFEWSDYLRAHEGKLNEHSNGKWLEFIGSHEGGKAYESVRSYVVPEAVLQAAIELCRSPHAQSLPGFIAEPLPSKL